LVWRLPRVKELAERCGVIGLLVGHKDDLLTGLSVFDCQGGNVDFDLVLRLRFLFVRDDFIGSSFNHLTPFHESGSSASFLGVDGERLAVIWASCENEAEGLCDESQEPEFRVVGRMGVLIARIGSCEVFFKVAKAVSVGLLIRDVAFPPGQIVFDKPGVLDGLVEVLIALKRINERTTSCPLATP
jgi:hypothetical protein